MKIAILQYSIVWADIQANLQLTEQRLSTIAGKADIAMLPEMFTTGFCTNRPDLAEDMNGLTIQKLCQWARDYDLAIVGSFMAKEGAKLVNRGFFIRPNGQNDFVDKRHLYAHGGEADFFEQGNRKLITEYKGCKFCLLICYDLRFPVWSRNQSGADYDILLYTANWPEIRIPYWDILLRARMIENQSYLCAVNRVGDDGIGLHYNGHSIALDTHLKPLAQFADNEEATKIAEFDIPALHHFRQTLPLWKDTDKFTIIP